MRFLLILFLCGCSSKPYINPWLVSENQVQLDKYETDLEKSIDQLELGRSNDEKTAK
jgi:hypothetical protein